MNVEENPLNNDLGVKRHGEQSFCNGNYIRATTFQRPLEKGKAYPFSNEKSLSYCTLP